MKKVCIFSLYDTNGASSRYRMYIFRKELEKNFDVVFKRFWSKKYIEKYMKNKKKYFLNICIEYIVNSVKRIYQFYIKANKYDVIIIQKCIIPKCRINNLKYLKKKGKKIIFDVDDSVFLGAKDYSDEIAKLSDIVFAGNDVLKEHYSKFCKKTLIIPTIDYSPAYKKYIKNNFEKKCIGWIGSNSTINNLDIIVEPINNIISRHPEVNFKIICNVDNGYTKKIKNCKFVKWSEETCIKEMSDFTIGIMPLKENEFNKGKCGFKLIQYLNMILPVIATDLGINKKIVSNYGETIRNESVIWEKTIENILFCEEQYINLKNNIENNFFDIYGYENIIKKFVNYIDEIA